MRQNLAVIARLVYTGNAWRCHFSESKEGKPKSRADYGGYFMRIDSPDLSVYGSSDGAKRKLGDWYTFDGAAGSAGISFKFPDGWEKFNTVVFSIEANNLRPDDGEMALIVNDGHMAWGPPIAKGPYPWIDQGASTLTFPASVFTSGAASFQLNETFGHSNNWEIAVKSVEFQLVEKNYLLMDNPDFEIGGDTSNTTRNMNGSYTFIGDESALLCVHFPEGWKTYENVTFFIDNVENHTEKTTMSLIIKNQYKSWTDVDKNYAHRYPRMEEGNNFFTCPTLVFHGGTSLQLNQYGHSTNWTMHLAKIVFHDGPIKDVRFD